MSSADLCDPVVGDVVEVWWDGELRFFRGTLTRALPDDHFHLEYDDGDSEDVCLKKEFWRYADAGSKKRKRDPGGEKGKAPDGGTMRATRAASETQASTATVARAELSTGGSHESLARAISGGRPSAGGAEHAGGEARGNGGPARTPARDTGSARVSGKVAPSAKKARSSSRGNEQANGRSSDSKAGRAFPAKAPLIPEGRSRYPAKRSERSTTYIADSEAKVAVSSPETAAAGDVSRSAAVHAQERGSASTADAAAQKKLQVVADAGASKPKREDDPSPESEAASIMQATADERGTPKSTRVELRRRNHILGLAAGAGAPSPSRAPLATAGSVANESPKVLAHPFTRENALQVDAASPKRKRAGTGGNTRNTVLDAGHSTTLDTGSIRKDSVLKKRVPKRLKSNRPTAPKPMRSSVSETRAAATSAQSVAAKHSAGGSGRVSALMSGHMSASHGDAESQKNARRTTSISRGVRKPVSLEGRKAPKPRSKSDIATLGAALPLEKAAVGVEKIVTAEKGKAKGQENASLITLKTGNNAASTPDDKLKTTTSASQTLKLPKVATQPVSVKLPIKRPITACVPAPDPSVATPLSSKKSSPTAIKIPAPTGLSKAKRKKGGAFSGVGPKRAKEGVVARRTFVKIAPGPVPDGGAGEAQQSRQDGGEQPCVVGAPDSTRPSRTVTSSGVLVSGTLSFPGSTGMAIEGKADTSKPYSSNVDGVTGSSLAPAPALKPIWPSSLPRPPLESSSKRCSSPWLPLVNVSLPSRSPRMSLPDYKNFTGGAVDLGRSRAPHTPSFGGSSVSPPGAVSVPEPSGEAHQKAPQTGGLQRKVIIQTTPRQSVSELRQEGPAQKDREKSDGACRNVAVATPYLNKPAPVRRPPQKRARTESTADGTQSMSVRPVSGSRASDVCGAHICQAYPRDQDAKNQRSVRDFEYEEFSAHVDGKLAFLSDDVDKMRQDLTCLSEVLLSSKGQLEWSREDLISTISNNKKAVRRQLGEMRSQLLESVVKEAELTDYRLSQLIVGQSQSVEHAVIDKIGSTCP